MNGTGVSQGYAVGTAFVYVQKNFKPAGIVPNVPHEEERLRNAVEQAKKQIQELAGEARSRLSEKNAEIIDSQLNFLSDPAFTGEAMDRIKSEDVTAEKAVDDVTQSLYDCFMEFEDEYTRERAEDIKDVGGRILNVLTGSQACVDFKKLPKNTVLVAHDLKPSDTVQLSSRNVCAIVTETGGKTSHTAILAKALGITAVVGCKGVLSAVRTGESMIVDGYTGEILTDPDDQALQQYRALREHENELIKKARLSAKKEICASDGKKITVAANIGSLDDLENALQNGADGVGLFRTEFLFLGRVSMPTEEEQYKVYRRAAEMLDDRQLTIRTLDIGGDKTLPYLQMEPEANPFLGLRAIRLCLKNPELFKMQLRAVLRASAYGNIQVMFPMISSLGELDQAIRLLYTCKAELRQAGVPYDTSIKAGVMIEIPAAAVLADSFAEKADFFSIGTNDLTQYTLAVDRMNGSIMELYDAMHPAVLKLIQITIGAAHRAGIPCCMCGELASDKRATRLLLDYGLDEFSVSPGLIPQTKDALLEIISG